MIFYIFQDYVLNEAKCRTIVRQICRGVEFIHKEGFIHLDIKPFNIVFYARNSDYDLRIIDFGLARALLGCQGIKVGMCGTIEYMSPEVSKLAQNMCIFYKPLHCKNIKVWMCSTIQCLTPEVLYATE